MGFKVGNSVSKSMTNLSFPQAQFALHILEFETPCTIRYTLLYIDRGVYMGKYTPRAPEGYILKNQPTCKDGGLLLNMAQTSEWNEQVRAILRSNPTSVHGG